MLFQRFVVAVASSAAVLLSAGSMAWAQEIKFESQAVADKALTIKSAKGHFKVASPGEGKPAALLYDVKSYGVAVITPTPAADAKGAITAEADVTVDTKCSFGLGVRQADDTQSGYLILFNRYSDQNGQIRIFRAGVWPPPDLSENTPLDMKQGGVLKPGQSYRVRATLRNDGKNVKIDAQLFAIDESGEVAANAKPLLSASGVDDTGNGHTQPGKIALRVNCGEPNTKVVIHRVNIAAAAKEK